MKILPGIPHVFDCARKLYSIPQVRMDLRCPLRRGEREGYSDIVKLVAFHFTGQTAELSSAVEWFGERIAIDYPSERFSIQIPQHTGNRNQLDFTRTVRLKARPRKTKKPFGNFHRSPLTPKKNTDNGKKTKKAQTMGCEKAQTKVTKKTPTYTTKELKGVVSKEELRILLKSHGQDKWTSRVRLSGLLTLIDFLIRLNRKERKFRKKGPKGFLISQDLARNYVSDLIERPDQVSIRVALNVLQKIGLIVEVDSSKFTPYQKCSARFQFGPEAKSRFKHVVELTTKVHEKFVNATERNTNRLNKKYPWRFQLLRDLCTVDISRKGIDLALDLIKNKKKESNAKRLLKVVRGKNTHRANTASYGSIYTEISACPRELKPHLTLGGDPVALCDISHAHWCLLPKVLEDCFQEKPGSLPHQSMPPALAEEIDHYRDYLDEGDLYKKLCVDPNSKKQRKRIKKVMVKALNNHNHWNNGCAPYQALKARFPHLIRGIEEIKKDSNKAISPALQHLTAVVIGKALLRCQAQEIPAIPDTDCLICPIQHRETVCRIIGEEMDKLTGVKCLVDEIRYDPSPVPSHAHTNLTRFN